MSTPILIPQLGNEINEAEITEWLFKVGDPVAQGDLLVVITTTKMAMELEAPASGSLTAILADEGELVEVGATIGEIS